MVIVSSAVTQYQYVINYRILYKQEIKIKLKHIKFYMTICS